jgi:hypothetical protein
MREELIYTWKIRAGDYYGPLKITHKLLDLTHGEDGLKFAITRNSFNPRFDRWLRYAGLLSMATKDAPVFSLARAVRRRFVYKPVLDLEAAKKTGNNQPAAAGASPKTGTKGGASGPKPKGAKAVVDQVVKRLRNGRTVVVDEDNLWFSDDDYYDEPKVNFGASSGDGGPTDGPPSSPSKKKPETEELRPDVAVQPKRPEDSLPLYGTDHAFPVAANG